MFHWVSYVSLVPSAHYVIDLFESCVGPLSARSLCVCVRPVQVWCAELIRPFASHAALPEVHIHVTAIYKSDAADEQQGVDLGVRVLL